MSSVATNGDAGLSGPVPAGYQILTDRLAIAKETYPVQEVTIELTNKGFIPSVVVVKAGQEVLWNIKKSIPDGDLGSQILIPDYVTKKPLVQGENPLFFFLEGSFDFSTGDNEFYGYVKVVDNLDAVDTEAIKVEVSNFETLIYPPETFQTAGASGTGDASQAAEATLKDGVQYVTSNVSGGGYEPIKVKKGIPVKWTLNAPEGSLNGCNNAINIPEYNLQVDLKTGGNLIEFTPDKSGTFAFSCWMVMVRSSIILRISIIMPER